MTQFVGADPVYVWQRRGTDSATAELLGASETCLHGWLGLRAAVEVLSLSVAGGPFPSIDILNLRRYSIV